jgi:anaphase-promoting complex subunit 8
MLLALGETYEKLDNRQNALKCYHKACNVGDIEGFAMLKLGSLYEKVLNNKYFYSLKVEI